MSVSEKLTGLMNAVRSMSGITDKLSVDDATSIAGSAGQWGVRVPNLISGTSDKIQHFETTNNGKNGDMPWETFSVAKSKCIYSVSFDVSNPSADLEARIVCWNHKWEWIGQSNVVKIPKEISLKNVQLSYTTPSDFETPGFLIIYIHGPKGAVSFDYKKLMANEGNCAPYTTATKPYTVDSLAERLSSLDKLNLFQFKTVYGVFSEGMMASLTAPEVPGYTLLCWINAASDGQVLPVSIQDSTEKEGQFWCYQKNTVSGDVHFHAIAVYIKSGFANVVGGGKKARPISFLPHFEGRRCVCRLAIS